MRYRRPRSGSRTPHLEDHDGLACAACLFGSPTEFVDRTDTLDIGCDHLGVGVIRVIVDQVGKFDIDLIASCRQLAEADPARGTTRQEGAQNAAALGCDGNATDWQVADFECAA